MSAGCREEKERLDAYRWAEMIPTRLCGENQKGKLVEGRYLSYVRCQVFSADLPCLSPCNLDDCIEEFTSPETLCLQLHRVSLTLQVINCGRRDYDQSISHSSDMHNQYSSTKHKLLKGWLVSEVCSALICVFLSLRLLRVREVVILYHAYCWSGE